MFLETLFLLLKWYKERSSRTQSCSRGDKRILHVRAFPASGTESLFWLLQRFTGYQPLNCSSYPFIMYTYTATLNWAQILLMQTKDKIFSSFFLNRKSVKENQFYWVEA